MNDDETVGPSWIEDLEKRVNDSAKKSKHHHRRPV